GRDGGEGIRACSRRLELAARARPFVEELAHVGDEVSHDREIRERRDLEAAAAGHLVHVRAAGPARRAVHHHGARAAHAHAAGEAIRERRVEMALDIGDDVEHRLALLPRNFEFLEPTVLVASPDGHTQCGRPRADGGPVFLHVHATTTATTTASSSVSATTSMTGFAPMCTSDFSDVFMPMAAIAVTRHQREKVEPASI